MPAVCLRPLILSRSVSHLARSIMSAYATGGIGSRSRVGNWTVPSAVRRKRPVIDFSTIDVIERKLETGRLIGSTWTERANRIPACVAIADLRTIVRPAGGASCSIAAGPVTVISAAIARVSNASEKLTFGRLAQPVESRTAITNVADAWNALRLGFSDLCALRMVIVYLRSGSICGVCRVHGSFVEISAIN